VPLEDKGAKHETIPAVGLFDVIEHIPDDAGFMTRIHNLLIPGGRVYLTVPAYGWLWSHEDVLARHSRRYTIQTLCRLFERNGYAVDFATYFFEFLPLPVLLRRALPYRLGLAPKTSPSAVRSDHEASNPLIARILESLTRRELSRIAAGRSLAWGGSCLAVARKDQRTDG